MSEKKEKGVNISKISYNIYVHAVNYLVKAAFLFFLYHHRNYDMKISCRDFSIITFKTHPALATALFLNQFYNSNLYKIYL